MHFSEESHVFTKQYCVCICGFTLCRFDEKESKGGLDGSLVQHGGEYESKGVPAMLERLYELPEGKKFWVHYRWKFMSISFSGIL